MTLRGISETPAHLASCRHWLLPLHQALDLCSFFGRNPQQAHERASVIRKIVLMWLTKSSQTTGPAVRHKVAWKGISDQTRKTIFLCSTEYLGHAVEWENLMGAAIEPENEEDKRLDATRSSGGTRAKSKRSNVMVYP